MRYRLDLISTADEISAFLDQLSVQVKIKTS